MITLLRVRAEVAAARACECSAGVGANIGRFGFAAALLLIIGAVEITGSEQVFDEPQIGVAFNVPGAATVRRNRRQSANPEPAGSNWRGDSPELLKPAGDIGRKVHIQ